MAEVNPEILRFVRLFDWDSRTGQLWWKPRTSDMFTYEGKYPKEGMTASWNKRLAGKEAFTAIGNNGYKVGAVFNKSYLAHRVLWFLEYGWWPEVFLDHINGDRVDNRLVNLRPVTSGESVKNQKLRATSKSGQHGVTWRKDTGKWHSRISVDRKIIILGDYENLDEAIEIRKQAEVAYGFHKNHGRA